MTDDPGPIDALDLAILDWVRDLYTAADPVPDGLLERIAFATDMRGLDAEVARLQHDHFDLVGVRGPERSRTITFDSESLTIVIQASPVGGAVRVDGWLAPPGVRRIRLRGEEHDLRTESDELGRFVLTDVRHGLVQLVVEAPDGESSEGGRTVVTTAVEL